MSGAAGPCKVPKRGEAVNDRRETELSAEPKQGYRPGREGP